MKPRVLSLVVTSPVVVSAVVLDAVADGLHGIGANVVSGVAPDTSANVSIMQDGSRNFTELSTS